MIDPPYNTGNDFTYKDDFAEDKNAYFQKSMQTDEEGNRLVANTESNGRFHSDWLSMMYPRLKLARNLLRDDGVIAVQIDDNEFHNMRKLLDEVFGEENFVSCVVVKMSNLTGMKMAHVAKKLPKIKEFVYLYAKNRESTNLNKVLIPCTWNEAFDRYTQIIENFDDPLDVWTFKNINHYLKSIDESKQESWLFANAFRIFRTATNDSVYSVSTTQKPYMPQTPSPGPQHRS